MPSCCVSLLACAHWHPGIVRSSRSGFRASDRDFMPKVYTSAPPEVAKNTFFLCSNQLAPGGQTNERPDTNPWGSFFCYFASSEQIKLMQKITAGMAGMAGIFNNGRNFQPWAFLEGGKFGRLLLVQSMGGLTNDPLKRHKMFGRKKSGIFLPKGNARGNGRNGRNFQ